MTPAARRGARANLDGSGVEELVTLAPNLVCGSLSLDLANGKMYLDLLVLLDPTNTAQLVRFNLDGTGQEVIPVAPNPHPATLGAQ